MEPGDEGREDITETQRAMEPAKRTGKTTAADALRSECEVRGRQVDHVNGDPCNDRVSCSLQNEAESNALSIRAPRTSVEARQVTASAATPRTEAKTVLRLKTRFPRE
jgi:hypothetical protein